MVLYLNMVENKINSKLISLVSVSFGGLLMKLKGK